MSNTLVQKESQITSSPKKAWQKPEFNVLATGNVNTGNGFNYREGSFTVNGNDLEPANPKHSNWSAGAARTKAFYHS